MLTDSGCQFRRQRLWEAVHENIEWLLIADPRHVNYLSNFMVNPLSFSGGERCLLLLEREHGATLLGDNFSLRAAWSQPYFDQEVVDEWYDHEHSVINRDQALFDALSQVAERLQESKGLLEAEWLPVATLPLLGLTARDATATAHLGTTIRSLRRQKEDDEIELLKVCMEAGAAGQARLREIISPGISELDIYREVQSAALKAAGRAGIVYGDFRACTKESPKQGGLPTQYELQQGDLFILDYSVMLDGYRSDFTNTMCVGEPTAQQRENFELCQRAMAAGEETLKAGAAAKNVYDAVAGPYKEVSKIELFTHHAGHGLGLAHPEPPILVPQSDDVLMAGDVVTLEPGAYEEGVGGIRIEHNYLITEDGYERLSHHEITLT